MKKGNLLLLIITLLILSIIVVYALIAISQRNGYQGPISTIESNIDKEIKEVKDRNNYYIVKNCVNKFYKYYATMFDTREDGDINKIYGVLDNQYILFKGITKENMLTVFPRLGDVVVNINNMWKSNQTSHISVYIVDGVLREELTNELSDFQIMIKIDTKNETFSVLLQDYIQEKHKNIELGNNLNIQDVSYLKSNRFNLYVAEDITDAKYIVDLFEDFKEEILYNSELAYKHLDNEYSSVKFGTISNFKKYIEENKERIINSNLEKYQKEEQSYYTQYSGLDQNGCYYIFRETGIMKYTLILDNYTIDLPEFLEKYNNTTTVRKAGYNIQKCLNAINAKDYAYVYNKLDFEFKALNYPTQKSFEEVIKAKLFNRNEVKTISSHNEGSTYIYTLTITDPGDNKKEQDMTVIMQLKEGTNFVMSLSFQ